MFMITTYDNTNYAINNFCKEERTTKKELKTKISINKLKKCI